MSTTAALSKRDSNPGKEKETSAAHDLQNILDHLMSLENGQRSLQRSFDAFEQRMLRALELQGGQRASRRTGKNHQTEQTPPKILGKPQEEGESPVTGEGASSRNCRWKEERKRGPSALTASKMLGEDTKHFQKNMTSSTWEPSSRLGRLITSDAFDKAISILLVLNMVFIGVQVQCSFLETTPPSVNVIDILFCLAFLLELSLRIIGLGFAQFWCHAQHRWWNIFDFVIVGLSAVDTMLSVIDGGNKEDSVLSNLTVLRVVRIVRIVRVLRVIRIAKFLTDLRILLAAIASTMKTASITFILIVLIMYVFSIAIAQITADHLKYQAAQGKPVTSTENNKLDLQFFFGGLFSALLSLYMSITGGVDWVDLIVPLYDVGPFAVFLFLLYSWIMMLCVLNVLLGIFCQNALDSAGTDTENIIQLQLQEKHRFVESLRGLFADWDKTGDGRCSVDDFIKHLSDKKTQAILRSLEIQSRDAVALSELIADDESGSVDLNDFVTGCISLRGTATAVHVEQVNSNNRAILERTDAIERKLEDLSLEFGTSSHPVHEPKWFQCLPGMRVP